MSFHTLTYLAFLPLVLVAFHRVASNARAWVLLGASLVFCAWLRAPLAILAAGLMVGISYVVALAIDAAATPVGRRAHFWGGVASNVAVLIALRAASFAVGRDATSKVIVTVGASYVLLQAISYLADVYLGIEKPERRLHRVVLCLTFFPKFVQGPVERTGPLLAQFDGLRPLESTSVREGLIRFGWGLFKKVVVADRLAGYVDYVYGNVNAHSGAVIAVATYLYGLQLYCDFAGYTDMAVGSARMLGIHLTENFDRPYAATSIADFWRRWHISLSRWLLEYIFKPLQLSWRGSRFGTSAAIFVTFAVSGIWHGATWTFAAWGLLHGLYLGAAILFQPYAKRLHAALRLSGTRVLRFWSVFATFQLVSFAWIFFRSSSFSDATYLITHLGLAPRGLGGLLLAQGQREALVTLVLLSGLGAAIMVRRLAAASERVSALALRLDASPTVRWLHYYGLVLSILVLGRFTTQSFIYANF